MKRTGNRLSESFLNAIEDRIASGEYPPGVRLDEVELAAKFGVSRTPIREALIRLGSTGMIEKRPRKGWVVTEASPSHLIEMFEVAAELEAMCGSPGGATRDAIPATENTFSARSVPWRYGPRYVLHAQRAVSRCSLRGEYQRLLDREGEPNSAAAAPLSPSAVAGAFPDCGLFHEHQEIVDAILAGDGERAAEWVRAHINVQGQRFSDLMASIEELTRAA